MPEPEEIPVQPVEQPPGELPEETPDTAAWRLVGEVFDTYVIVEQGDKTFLIDKHAAHERMNFDRMRAAIEPALEEIASKLLLTGTANPAAVRDEVLHTMACKAAIKGGWKSDRAELEVVVRAVMCGQVKYCPHGRPVAIELSKQQLEKQFKRS